MSDHKIVDGLREAVEFAKRMNLIRDALHRGKTMTHDEEISQIKHETFGRLKNSRRVWIIEEAGADFVVHQWSGPGAEFGSGVAPPSTYPTLRKAAARLLQLLQVGAVAPQTWPEKACIGTVDLEAE